MTQESTIETTRLKKRHPMLIVLRTRNLRLLWIGEGFSVLGSQFYMIALPWLVLQLTGDPFKMGTVLALAGIPRAMFMLVGGAFTDRFSPRKLMVLSSFSRMMILALLASLVWTNNVDMWILYGLSLLFGLADAFFYPAQSAILPLIVDQELLLAGNSIVQGTAQLSVAAGPALAGALIAVFSGAPEVAAMAGTETVVEVSGIAIAFGINALTCLIAIVMFAMIRVGDFSNPVIEKTDQGSMFSFFKEGIVHAFKDKTLRLMLLVTAVAHFLAEGPLMIGIPVLANTRFEEGAAAFGIIMSGLGAGMLIGIILAGVLPKLNPKIMGTTLLLILSSSGLELMIVGFMPNAYATALVVMLMGIALGYVVIQYSTWMQIRTPESMLGRTLSIMIFASVGLVPVSQALCGALIKISITGLFLGAGIIMTIINILVALRPEIRDMGLEIESKRF
ncbi:MAG: MFS transporter [Proteobacteria bacterium]|nr:MFS transporter [Pseudomonadota bacterium]